MGTRINNKPPYGKILAVLALLIAIVVVSQMGYADVKAQQRAICLNVVQWELDRLNDIEPNNRRGYPANSHQQRKECLGNEQ